YLKEIQLLMARAYGPGSYDPSYERQGRDYPLPYVRWTENRNMEEGLRLMGTGRLNVKPLITHPFPLGDGARGYDTILNPSSGSLGVIIEYPEPVEATSSAPKTTIAVTSAPKATGEIGFALIGAGNLAKWAHLPALKKVSGVSLRAVHSSN